MGLIRRSNDQTRNRDNDPMAGQSQSSQSEGVRSNQQRGIIQGEREREQFGGREVNRRELVPRRGGLGFGAETGSPFSGMRRFMDEVDRLFWGSVRSPFEPTSAFLPAMEMQERDNRLEVRVDLPGIKPDDVSVEVEGDALVISGERKSEHETQDGGVYHCERSYGSFQRTVALPSGVDPSAVDARFQDGVLEITLPLPENKPTGRRIEIRSGSGSGWERGRRDGSS